MASADKPVRLIPTKLLRSTDPRERLGQQQINFPEQILNLPAHSGSIGQTKVTSAVWPTDRLIVSGKSDMHKTRTDCKLWQFSALPDHRRLNHGTARSFDLAALDGIHSKRFQAADEDTSPRYRRSMRPIQRVHRRRAPWQGLGSQPTKNPLAKRSPTYHHQAN